MPRFLKDMFGQPYSYEDLVKESAPFFSNPSLPAGLPEVMSHFDGKTRTFLEFIQVRFKEILKEIAERGTKQDQKAQLLAVCLEERSWIAGERAAKDAKHLQSWSHFVKGSAWFERSPETDWKRLLTGRFLMAITCDAWLIVLGRRLYQLEDYIELALDLFVDYDAEIKTLDVNMFEEMFHRLTNYDDDQAMYIAKLKDEVFNPIMKQQYAILDRLAKDIQTGKMSVETYRAEFARIDEIKQHVARTITAMALPN